MNQLGKGNKGNKKYFLTRLASFPLLRIMSFQDLGWHRDHYPSEWEWGNAEKHSEPGRLLLQCDPYNSCFIRQTYLANPVSARKRNRISLYRGEKWKLVTRCIVFHKYLYLIFHHVSEWPGFKMRHFNSRAKVF